MGMPIEALVALGVIVLGVLIVIAPLAIWIHVSKLRKELEKTNRLLRAQYDVLAKFVSAMQG